MTSSTSPYNLLNAETVGVGDAMLVEEDLELRLGPAVGDRIVGQVVVGVVGLIGG